MSTTSVLSQRSVLLLRRLKDLPLQHVKRAAFSPNLSIIAFMDNGNKLYLYYLGKDTEACGFIPEFLVEDVSTFAWLVVKNTQILIVESCLTLHIYHFRKTTFKNLRRLEIQDYEFNYAKSSSRVFFSLQPFTDETVDVHHYRLPFTDILKRVHAFNGIEKVISDISITSLKLIDTITGPNIVFVAENQHLLSITCSDTLAFGLGCFIRSARNSALRSVVVEGEWIFALDEDSYIQIWNMSGLCKTVFNINQYFKADSAVAYRSIGVAADLGQLVALSDNNCFYTIQLDHFFKNNPHAAIPPSSAIAFNFKSGKLVTSKSAASSADVILQKYAQDSANLQAVAAICKDTRDEAMRRRELLRWFENDFTMAHPSSSHPSAALDNLSPAWTVQSPLKLPGFSTLPSVVSADPMHYMYLQTAGNASAARRTYSLTLNGFNSKAMRQEVPGAQTDPILQQSQDPTAQFSPNVLVRSIFDRAISVPFGMNVVDMFVVGPTKLVALVRKESSSTTGLFALYDRATGEETVVSAEWPLVYLPDTKIAALYFLNSNGLGVLLHEEISDEKLTNGLIIFNKPQHADLLYEINGWDRRALRLHTLSLGLRYRQLDVIEPALRNLDEDQYLAGSKMLIKFIKKNTALIQDEKFWDELLNIGMTFISGIIRIKSQQVGVRPNAYAELQKFAKFLAELREAHARVKTMARNTAMATDKNAQKSKQRTSRERDDRKGLRGQSSESLTGEISRSLTSDVARSISSTGSVDGTISRSVSDNRLGQSPEMVESVSSTSPPSIERRLSGIGLESVDASKLEELDEALFSAGGLRDRWEKMKTFEIIGDALVSGNLSLALSYLRWRSKQYGQREMNDTGANSITLQRVRRVAYSLIYQTAARSQFNLVKRMICNLGEDVDDHFKSIAWFTSIREVRNALLSHLKDTGKLSPKDLETIKFARLIEEQYPNADYGLEFSRLQLSKLGEFQKRSEPLVESEELDNENSDSIQLIEAVPYHSEFSCADLSDFAPNGLEFRLDRDRAPSQNSEPVSPSSGVGYAWFRMEWLEKWKSLDPSLQASILLESLILKKADWKLPSLLTTQNIPYIISYFVAHNDWTRLLELISHFFASLNTKLSVSSEGVTDLTRTSSEIQTIISTLSKESRNFTTFAREFVFRDLARRGVLMAEEVNNKTLFVHRLASSGNLFPTAKMGNVDLAELLPVGRLSPMHYTFIQFCIDHKLPTVLVAYLDAFNLARTPEQIHHLLTSGHLVVERSWVQFLLLLRSEETLFDASLVNAKLALESKNRVSVNSMISSSAKEKRPFMALGTLVFSPVSLREALTAPKDAAWYVSSRHMADFLAKYPILQKALFPDSESTRLRIEHTAKNSLILPAAHFNIMSSQQDINLYYLLDKSAPFSLEAVLGASADPIPSFSSPAFKHQRFVDSIDVAYYLTKGEPLQAFMLLLSRKDDALMGIAPASPRTTSPTHERVNEPLNLSLAQMNSVMLTARAAAIRNVYDDAVIAACVAFLELCNINSQQLRVDVEAMRRILHHKSQLVKSESRNKKTIKDEQERVRKDITDLFLSFSMTGQAEGAYSTTGRVSINRNTESIHTALAMLVESTKALKDEENVPSKPTKHEASTARKAQSEGAAEANKWRLVAQFCTLYGLPLPSEPLVALASRNDWVGLLHYAQSLCYPMDIVLNVINAHISNKSLREHLLIAVKQLSKTSGLARDEDTSDELSTQAEGPTKRPDLFKLLLGAASRMYAGEMLLQNALRYKWSLLAVVAQCFTDVDTQTCLGVWLHTTLSTLSVSNTDVDSGNADKQEMLISELENEQRAAYDTRHSAVNQLPSITPATIQNYIIVLISHGYYAYALRAFQLFEPTNPLCHWFLFLQTFSQYRFQAARAHIDTFMRRLRDHTIMKIGDNSWALEIAKRTADLSIARLMPTSFERREFLKLLAEAKVDAKYDIIYRNYLLMLRIGLTGLDEQGHFSPPEPTTIIDELLKRKMFEEARQLSKMHGLPQDDVTVREAEEMVNACKQHGLWKVFFERTHLWMSCNDLFLRHKCNPAVAGEFFYARAQHLANVLDQKESRSATDTEDHDLPENLTVYEAASEHVTLLSLARAWFDGTHNEQVNQWSTLTEDRYAWRPEAILQDIDAKMLRSSVIAQSEAHNPTKQRVFGPRNDAKPALNLNNVDSSVLDTMIGSLLNDDNFSEAERISVELKHPSKDLRIANTMLGIATGSLAFDEIESDIQQLMRAKAGTQLVLSEMKAIDILELLARCAKHARECCERIVVRFKTAHLFSVTYDGIQSKDPYDVLQFLLMEGPEQYSLCKQFIQTHKLSPERVAQVIGERCFREIVELDATVGRTQYTPEKSSAGSARSISRESSVENFALSLADTFTMAATGASHIPAMSWGGSVADLSGHSLALSFVPSTPAMMGTTPASAASPHGTPVKHGQPHAHVKPRFWSSRYFPDYLDLTRCPAVVGDELQRQLQKTLTVSPVVEVEIFIRALMAYRRAQDVQKQAKLFALIKERVPVYAKAKQYRVLVRLITGTKQYTQLQYVLDILVQADCFDMLLAKNVAGDQSEDKRELAMSLYNYLKTKHPTSFDKMKLLFLRFAMYREHADVLQERAWAALNTMKSRLDPACMLQAMDNFIEAAANYAKDKAFALEKKCLDNANLIQLQFELPDVRVVNLKPGEAEQLMLHCPEFEYCRIIANAYNLNSLSEWAESVYHHVIISGNFAFYEEFAANVSLDMVELFTKLVKKFKADNHKGSVHVNNMKRLLEYLDDCHMRYKFAQELGFTDVMESLIDKVFGLEYFVTAPHASGAVDMGDFSD